MKGQHKKKKINGSTVIIIMMYITWIAYIGLQIWCISQFKTYLPTEVTFCTAALFITETAALAKLKMAKEGCSTLPKEANDTFLSKIGLSFKSDFDDQIAEINKKLEKHDTTLEEHNVSLDAAKASLQGIKK